MTSLSLFLSVDCCSRLNRVTGPRLVLLVVHSLVLLSHLSWLLLLLSLPFTLWQLRLRLGVGSGDFGVFDPTKIIVRDNLRRGIKESLAYMGYHMASFFIYMWQLVSLLSPESDGSRPVPISEVPW